MAADRLVELLSRLPVDSKISVNGAGNLLARNGGVAIAIINFYDGSLWWYDGQFEMED
jgi:hypothetical protein